MPTAVTLLAAFYVIAAPAVPAQASENHLATNGLVHLAQSEKSPTGEIVSGVGEMPKAGIKATKDVTQGVAESAEDVSQGQVIKGAADLGKGTLKGAADVTEGALKGGAKVTKGVLQGAGCIATLGKAC